jgi:hypothetical protein
VNVSILRLIGVYDADHTLRGELAYFVALDSVDDTGSNGRHDRRHARTAAFHGHRALRG